MRKGLVLVVMCVAMLFAAASSVSAQAPNDEYKATLEKCLNYPVLWHLQRLWYRR